MRDIFLEKSYTKRGGESSPRSYSKTSKLRITFVQHSKFLYDLFFFVVFFVYPSRGLSKHIETKVETTCFYLI